MKKALKIVRIISIIIFLIVIGLFINNRIYYSKYSSKDITANMLSDSEIDMAENIFKWLEDNGSEIFDGFDNTIDLIMYNRSYEFLFTTNEYEGWEYVASCSDGKSIYRRRADNPQAFAVKIDDTWVGSFSTHDFFNVSILEQIPIIIPPQLFTFDDIGYRSIVVHEMFHAYQGKCDYERIDKAEHIHDICNNYFSSKDFNDYIEQEGEILQEAINAYNNDINGILLEFLSVRDKRRNEFKMSDVEIANEQEIEWLEGSARYVEYIAAKGSNSSVSKGLGNITEKVKTQGDERYYTLGMAQILLIKHLNIEDWQEKLLYKGYTPESILREYMNQ